MGLSFYTEAEAGLYFGRDSERQVIMGNLRASRLTLLYAESGVGKSSLLRAGVASRLRELAQRSLTDGGSACYVPVVFSSWRDDPVEELIDEIQVTVDSFLRDDARVKLPRETLGAAIDSAVDALDGAAATEDETDRPEATLLVILDQFEEYFLYGSREARAGRFVDDLAECINRQDMRANFLISIREDAYSVLGDLLKGRMSNVYGNYLHLEYLDSSSAREAIEKPIERYNHDRNGGDSVTIEPGLVDAVLAQVRRETDGGQQPGNGTDQAPTVVSQGEEIVTPYLQLVMATLWERELSRGSHTLRLSTLEELHGAERIVGSHLDSALNNLQAQERELAIDVLDHLVTPSGTKIALEVGDLTEYTKHPSGQVAPVLKKLAGEARILREVPPAPGKPADNDIYRRFEIYHDVLSGPIRETVKASASRRLELETRAAQERAQHERRRARKFRLISVGALALAAIALLATIGAVLAGRAASSEKQLARSRQIAASSLGVLASDPELAALLALRALDVHKTGLAESALRAALPQLQVQRTLNPRPPAYSVAFSPNGKLIATATADGIAHLWDAGSHEQVGSLGVSGLTALTSVAFSPDGKRIVTAYGDATARVWSASSRRQEGAPLTEPQGGNLTTATFTPDGKQIVTAGNAGFARIWDVRTHRQSGAEMNHQAAITSAAFSPDGKMLVTAGADSTAKIWYAGTHQLRGTLTDTTNNPIYRAAFSPDSKLLITSDAYNSAQVWDVRADRSLGDHPVRGLNDPSLVVDAQFSPPKGKLIVTAGLDGKARIWDATATGKTPLRVLGEATGTSILEARFSPNGEQVVTADADGVARVWDTRKGTRVAVLEAASKSIVQSAAFSPDASLIVTGTYDGTVSVWNATTGRARFHFAAPRLGGITKVRFNSSGRAIVAAGDDGWTTVLDAQTGALLTEFASPVPPGALTSAEFNPVSKEVLLLTAGQEASTGVLRVWKVKAASLKVGQVGRAMKEPGGGQINGASYSPNGKRIVTASADGSAYVWDAQARSAKPIGAALAEPQTHQGKRILNSAAFSHDGKLIVTASDDGTAHVWDATRPRHKLLDTLYEPQDNGLLDAQFSPDDRLVATASRDGTARVWDLASHRQMLVLSGHSGGIKNVAFSPDGTRLVTASADGTVRLWSASPIEQRGSTISEPRRQDVTTSSFSPAGRLIVTASTDGTARLWDATTPEHRLVGKLSAPHRAGLSSAEFSADGKLIVTADSSGTASIWDVQSQKLLATLPDSSAGSLASAEFSPDGKLIVTAGRNGARVWDATAHTPLGANIDANNSLRWAVFNSTSKLIVTAADSGGTARVWDVHTRRQAFATLTEPGGEAVSDAWFSPNSQLVVTSSDDGTARVWRLSTGAQVSGVTEPGRSSMYNAVLGPDGRFVLTANQDGTARIWSAASGTELTAFNAGNPIADAEFSPSGDRVVTASAFGGARVFSTELAGPLRSIESIARQRLTRKLTNSEERKYVSGGGG